MLRNEVHFPLLLAMLRPTDDAIDIKMQKEYSVRFGPVLGRFISKYTSSTAIVTKRKLGTENNNNLMKWMYIGRFTEFSNLFTTWDNFFSALVNYIPVLFVGKKINRVFYVFFCVF